MITVVVIEPSSLLRSGILEHLAQTIPGSNFVSADYSALSDGTSGLQSDLVLLSVLLSENAGSLLTATRRIYTPKSILLLIDREATSDTWQSHPLDIAGHVPRDASPEILAAAVHLVLAGGSCFQKSHQAAASVANQSKTVRPDRTTTSLFTRADNPMRRATDRVQNECALATDLSPPGKASLDEAKLLSITPRQYEVLVLLARGNSTKDISQKLNISAATVKVHTEALFQRLGAHNRNQAVYAAISLGATLGWNHLRGPSVSSRAPQHLYEHS